MANERTDISTLGEKHHLKYIQGIQESDRRLIEESSWVPQKTTAATTKPYAPTEFDLRFSLSNPRPSAHFFPPPKGMEREGLFFRQEILPSDSYEKRDAFTDKLTQLEETIKDLPPDVLADVAKVKGGIQTLSDLTRLIGQIKARLNQFQRG